jgi:hypothetical protein
MYAEFAKVAEKNPLAWNYGQPAATEEIIGTVSKKNRMICFPCTYILVSWTILIRIDPLLMNAFNNVNLAGACILTSSEYARELGIPEDRWIYPLGGAGTSDSSNCKYSFQIIFPADLMQFGRGQITTQAPQSPDHSTKD